MRMKTPKREESPDLGVPAALAINRPNGVSQQEQEQQQQRQVSSPPPPPPPQQRPRRSSFSFLRGQKSSEMRSASRSTSRSTSAKKISKKLKQDDLSQKQKQQEAAAVPQQAPRLPSHPPLPQLNSFGGENARPAYLDNNPRPSVSAYSIRPSIDSKMGAIYPPSFPITSSTSSLPRNVPIPPIPGSPPGAGREGWVDPYARTESMTNRGRYSYASSAVSTVNSPRRMRRRKDPTPFNILVVGAKNCGKTSFVDFLKTSLALSAKKSHYAPSPPRQLQIPNSPFTAQYLEAEIDSERIGLTLWDSQGLEKNIADLQLREMTGFVESKFEETFNEEQKVVRAPGVQDTHIHCVFLVLDPARLDSNIAISQKGARGGAAVKSSNGQRLVGGLDEELDLQVLRTLQGKTTVIPVISKADTVTSAHMVHLKKIVWTSLKETKLDPLLALSMDESDDDLDPGKFGTADGGGSTGDSSSDSSPTRHRRSSSSLSGVDDGNKKSNSENNDKAADTSDPPSPRTSSPSASRKAKPGHTRTASAMSAALNKNSGNSNKNDRTGDDNETPFLPFSILSPDPYSSGERIGRVFPWGFADPFSAEHCDFVRLKDSVFMEWRSELREAARERWYEGWRTSRLKRRVGSTTPQGQQYQQEQQQQQRMATGGASRGASGLSPVPSSRTGRGDVGVAIGGSPEVVRNGQAVGSHG